MRNRVVSDGGRARDQRGDGICRARKPQGIPKKPQPRLHLQTTKRALPTKEGGPTNQEGAPGDSTTFVSFYNFDRGI